MALSMVKVYYELVKAGRRTIETVPDNLRADVQALIDADAEARE
ncbi:MAG TPA: CD1375 family protein [Candidatus Nitrosocosmicus sp.]|nr:CD1375 family protein [Candidatus Nitrosocosmicus sp.]